MPRSRVPTALKLEGRPYDNFINSLKAKHTKIAYAKLLRKYITHYKTTLEELISKPVSETETMLIDYLVMLKKKDLSHSFINVNFCAIKHFYFMNSIRINKEMIAKFLGEPRRKNSDRGYENPELKLIADNCELRMKTVVLTLATTSMRIGALVELTLGDVEKIAEAEVYKFTIYRNAKEESICFCSPHCAQIIDKYLDYRRRAGDRLEKTDPFIRDVFDTSDLEKVRRKGRFVDRDTLSCILLGILNKIGLRSPNHTYTGRERKDVALNTGFRKWWMKQAVDANTRIEKCYSRIVSV